MIALFAGSTLFAAIVLMLAFPATPTGRALHRWLVEAPARFFLDMTWKKFGRCALLGLALPLLVMAGPETFALFIVLGGDAAAIELMIAVAALSMSGGLVAIWRNLRDAPVSLAQRVRRIGLSNRSRQRRKRKDHRPGRGRQNDDSGPGLAFA